MRKRSTEGPRRNFEEDPQGPPPHIRKTAAPNRGKRQETSSDIDAGMKMETI